MEVLPQPGFGQHLRMPLPQILAHRHQEAAGSAGWIAHNVSRFRLDHLHHQSDDVARRAKLPVLPRRRNLAQHVLVQIALGVPLFHGHLVNLIDDLCQQPRCWDRKARIFHVVGVGRPIPAQGSQPGKNMLADQRVHLSRFGVLELRPAILLISRSEFVLALGKHRPVYRLTGTACLKLFRRVQLVQALQE